MPSSRRPVLLVVDDEAAMLATSRMTCGSASGSAAAPSAPDPARRLTTFPASSSAGARRDPASATRSAVNLQTTGHCRNRLDAIVSEFLAITQPLRLHERQHVLAEVDRASKRRQAQSGSAAEPGVGCSRGTRTTRPAARQTGASARRCGSRCSSELAPRQKQCCFARRITSDPRAT
jgi:hypothetical protein